MQVKTPCNKDYHEHTANLRRERSFVKPHAVEVTPPGAAVQSNQSNWAIRCKRGPLSLYSRDAYYFGGGSSFWLSYYVVWSLDFGASSHSSLSHLIQALHYPTQSLAIKGRSKVGQGPNCIAAYEVMIIMS